MPTSGKPVFNPFAAASPTKEQAARPDLAEKPARPSLRKKRGISLLATEERLQVLSFKKATVLSAAFHLISPFVLALVAVLVLLILSWLLHLNFWDWFKPKPPKADMVFSLVSDTHAKRPEKPLFKGNFNQQAGGKKDPKQALKPIDDPAKASPASKEQQPAKTQQAVKPQPEQPKQEQAEPPKPVKKQEPKKEPPKPAAVSTVAKPQEAENTKKDNKQAAKNAKSAESAKANQQIASMGKIFSGSSASTSTDFSPQSGLSDTPGVDVAEDVDFGPYMAEITRRIKRNWQPLRSDRSRKITVEFYVNRAGQLANERGEVVGPTENLADAVKILQSSGDRDADLTAIDSIRLSAPFNSLPPQEKADLVPIDFTFDYNVLNPGGPKRASKR